MENIVESKSFSFALEIIKLYKNLANNKEFHLSSQILRSGTSIGANIKEAQHAQSRNDFIHKMSIALKEAYETEYWLELLHKSDYISTDSFNKLYPDCLSLKKMLISIIKTSKRN